MGKKFNWIWRQDLEEDERVHGDDDYGWNTKYEKQNKQKAFSWDDYKDKKWSGYEQYKPALLSYSYVEQMANVIASQHNVNLQTGKEWSLDLETKTLTYNPTQLMFGTRAELLATLLHEVGKIKLSTPYRKLLADGKSAWLTKYQSSAYEVTSTYDDFRVDDTMINAYPSAPELYESQAPTLKAIVTQYLVRSTRERNHVVEQMMEMKDRVGVMMHGMEPGYFPLVYKQVFRKEPPVPRHAEWQTLMRQEIQQIKQAANLPEYIAAVIEKGYGVPNNVLQGIGQEALDYQMATVGAISEVIKKADTSEVLAVMDKEVFPFIKNLLERQENGSPEMQSLVGKDIAKTIMQHSKFSSFGADFLQPDTQKARGSAGRGNDVVPKEWTTGEYQSLKESVSSDIRSLYSKLVNLRRKENVVRYETQQRRGKLNTRSLYKYATGNRRLFKKKFANIDTIRSFVFSVFLDTSGSMSGERIIHSTRALVMLAEVFEKLGMPFEIINFDMMGHSVKKFDEKFDKKIQARLAGATQQAGGGTELATALPVSKIDKRPELNRVLVVLTDGDVGDQGQLDRKFFRPWKEKGIKIIPIGIECDPDNIQRMSEGTGRNIDTPAELPQLFYDMVRGLITTASKQK